MKLTTAHRSRSGFTLIEMAFATAIAAALLYAVAYTSLRASRAYDEGQVRSSLVARAHQVADRIAGELDQAIMATLAPAPVTGVGSSVLSYQRVTGFAGGAVVPGNTDSIALLPDTNELFDGLDNDGDRRVDEGQVVWTQDVGLPTQRQVVLAHDVSGLLQGEVANLGDDNGNGLVDEQGLVFELQGNVLLIRLSLGDLDQDGRLVVKTVQTAVRIRN